jgi:Rieske Fe-S protein
MEQLSRRRMLASSGMAAAGAAAVGACSGPSSEPSARGAGLSSAPKSAPAEPPTSLADVSDLSSVPTETVDPESGNAAFLVKGPDGVTMLSAICTHMGCTVEWRSSEDEFVCPCHGAVYDPTGEAAGGPATGPLASLPVVVRHGQVFRR